MWGFLSWGSFTHYNFSELHPCCCMYHDVIPIYYGLVTKLCPNLHPCCCMYHDVIPIYYGLVTKLCPNLWDPVDYSPQGSSVHGISQARILEWVAISCPRRSSRLRDWTLVSCAAGRFLTKWTTREAPFLFITEWYFVEWTYLIFVYVLTCGWIFGNSPVLGYYK